MTSAWLLIQKASHRKLLGIPVGRWAVFLALTLVGFLVLRVLVSAARSRLKARCGLTEPTLNDYLLQLLERTWTLSLLAGAAVVALDCGALRPAEGAGGRGVEATVRLLALLLIFVQLGVWGTGLIDTALHRGFRYANFTETAAQTAFGVVRFFALVALWTSVTILVLSACGVEVTPLLAGLGVGGIAVGFALQKILGDIFCSVAIVLDRPFEVGDFIITGDHMGTVERIGVKTTRVRSLEGEQIIFPNSNLLDSRIRNCKRMTERRVVFSFAMPYATPVAALERIPGLVKEIIQGIERTRFDRAHFAAFGDSALHFEVVYYVLDPDYNLSMDIQQQINLALFRQLDERGVSFAFPSRRLYVEGTGVPLRTQVQLLEGGRVERPGGAAGDRSGTVRVQQLEEGQTPTT
jgi:small-conductance mechanosensitive channel